MVTHMLFAAHMIVMGILTALGQMFVYRMIKQFKQHFVPFVITTRKIFTVGFSIVLYHHETNAYQLFGLIMVFGVVTFEFVTELMSEKSEQAVVPLDQELVGRRGDSSLAEP
jgi:drug/metabolite transporter (DMT)-like permease